MSEESDIRTLIRQVIREYHTDEKERSEPAYKVELEEERRRREQLERRMNELVEENRRSRAMAEEAERQTAIRTELQKHGVTKLDLAFKVVKDDVRRTGEGQYLARGVEGDVPLAEYVTRFVQENPELLPARLSGGSGAASGVRSSTPTPTAFLDLDKIRPGMDPKDLARIREEVARVAQRSLSGG
ncbi:MAG: hypothetical protein IANPNBLG_00998 [Bryobacteraceae bacterium]|nr:hypothetical protein [Bryobacteraceae bacterium]MCC6344520.1 hypothetical protein [Bryobacterales bacterium]